MKAVLMPLIAFAICAQAQTLTDFRDGKNYQTVKIGSQMWMAENLNYNASGSVCYHGKPDNCAKYGRLYNWDTAMKACPYGWHLPSDEEWKILVNFAGGDKVAGKKLKAKSGWNGNGTDDFGFSALPGGDGYYNIGNRGYWWSSHESNSYHACLWSMDNYESVEWYISYKTTELLSVRCLRD